MTDIRAAVLTRPGHYEVQTFPWPVLPEGSALMQME
ncbi:MAG: hypothetical protein RL347_561, partial [Actinomycetota bacterium]